MRKLLLLPGLDGTGRLFAPIIDQLSPVFDATIMSYPPDHGLSYPELAPIVQAAFPSSEPFALVAESFSSPLAVICAAQAPPNLRGLILCAGFVTSPVSGWRRLLASTLVSVSLEKSVPDIAAMWLLAGSRAPEPLLAAIRSAIASVDPCVLQHRVRTVLACNARASLVGVNVPILYLQATRDRIVDRFCLEEIRRLKPQTKIERIVAPHLVLQREPAKAAAAVNSPCTQFMS